MTCSANASNIPTARQEGITEQIGDIVITCMGGNATDGLAASQVNITVTLISTITTRLESTSGVGGITASDALLLIDEPTTGCVPGVSPCSSGYGPVPYFGSNAAFNACPNPTTGGCSAAGYHVVGTDGSVYVVETTGASPAALGANQAPNVYQGIVNSNQVTFFGVPVVAPGSNGIRIYRITGIRTDASTFSNGAVVQAFVTTSNPAALPISNAQPIVGFVSASLITSVAGTTSFAQGGSQTLAPAGILTFSEANNFASAFQTRVDPIVPRQSALPGPTTGQGSALVQNVPGTIYNGESGFTPGNLSGLIGTNIGLADFGTRFRAVFTNLLAGVKLYVSTVNVNVASGVATGPVTIGAPSFAALVTGDSAAEGSFVASTVTGPNFIPLVEIDTPGSSTASATWEVITTRPTAIDTYQFAVYISYTASPAVGAASVNLAYAPTSTIFTSTSADPIPRFLDTSVAANLEISVTASGLAYSRVSQTFNGTVTIKNSSSAAISGPFQIVFTLLTAGVQLTNTSGVIDGSPFITVPGVTNLEPGQTATTSVQFKDPSDVKIQFTPEVISGSIN